MTINFQDGSAGLFDVLGKLFFAAETIVTASGTTVRDELEDIVTQHENVTPDDLDLNAIIAEASTVADSFDSAAGSSLIALRQIARDYLIEVVDDDDPLTVKTFLSAITELRTQMIASSDTFDASTVAVSVAAVGSLAGNGVLVATEKRGDGLVQQAAYAETIKAELVTDGSTSFTITGEPSVDQLALTWPQGSGAAGTLNATSPASSLVTSGGFDTLSTLDSNVPSGWIASIAQPGVTVKMTTPEQQTIAIAGSPAAGYYLLHYTNSDGKVQTTEPISYNAAATTVQSRLRSLAGLESVTVSETGTSPNVTHTVTFLGAGGDVALLTSTNRMSGGSSTNEVQTITLSDTDGGTFTLTYDGQTTAAIAWDATAAAVQTALEALSNIEVGDVVCAGGPLPAAVTCTFQGGLGAQNVVLMTIDTASLTNTAPAISVVETTAGSPAQNEQQEIQLYGTPTGGTITLTSGGQTTSAIAYNASAATVESELEALSTIDNVAVTGGPLPAAVTIEFQGTQANTDVDTITISTSGLTGGAVSGSVTETTPGAAGLLDGLTAYWDLSEPSYTSRIDEVGGLLLVDQGGLVANATGKNGSGIVINTTSGELEASSAAAFSMEDNDFAIAVWVKMDGTSQWAHCVNRNSSYTLAYNGTSSRFYFQAYNGDTATVSADTFGAPATGTWYLLIAQHDSVSDTISISVNNGTADSTAFSGGVNDSGAPLIVGPFNANPINTDYYIDEVMIWNRTLSASETSTLYNSGTGTFYGSFATGTDEVQQISLSGTPSRGTFTLTYDGQTTAAIAYNASAATVETELGALSTLSASDVSCSGGSLPGTAVDVTFDSSLGDVALLTLDDTDLISRVESVQTGDPGTNEVQTVTLTGDATGGTFTLTHSASTTSAIAYNANAATVEAALDALGIANFSVTGAAGGPWTVTYGGALATTDVALMTGNAASATNADPSGLIVETTAGSDDSGSISHAESVAGTAQVYSGTYALLFESDGSELTQLDTKVTVSGETAYAMNLWLTVAATAGSGAIQFSLVDGISGTVINDSQGNANTLTVNVSDLTTGWQSLDDVLTGDPIFRLPEVVPSLVYLRMRFSTAPPSGTKVYFDHLALVAMTELYAGGPLAALFAGNDAYRVGDTYTITVTNDRAGKLHEWMARTFDLAANRVLLPVDSGGTETIPDSVVS